MSSRFWAVIAMLTVTGLLIWARGSTDRIPVSEPLSHMPHTVGGWSGNDLQLDPDSLEVLGPGDFLSRAYALADDEPAIELFVGYFPSQRTGVSIHSPKNCLPGAGWAFESSSSLDLMDVNGKPHRVGEYVVTDGESREFIIYWYQAHGRSVANEYMAKIYLALDAMRTNRTDGALVRIATPIGLSEGPASARARVEAFAAQLAPILPRFIPD